MLKKVLVIPSNRENCLVDFLRAWDGPQGDWDEVILLEDGPGRTFKADVDVHLSWTDIDEALGPDAWIISRGDSARRCFGFVEAVRRGATHVLTLDDDCYPHPGTPPIFAAHLDAMASHPRWVPSIPGMRTRGLPYRNLGRMTNVVASMGLWSRIPDLDSVQSLNDLAFATDGRFVPPEGRRIAPAGQFLPICGMNLAFKAEVAPLMYFPLMGHSSRYRRFDDIWGGMIAKRILDHLGLAISVGEPWIEHRRASDPMVNLVKEAPGIAANETYWEAIAAPALTESTPAACMAELGLAIQGHPDDYLAQMGRAMEAWSRLFRPGATPCRPQPWSSATPT